jgi:hypothetical protein
MISVLSACQRPRRAVLPQPPLLADHGASLAQPDEGLRPVDLVVIFGGLIFCGVSRTFDCREVAA